MTNGSIEEEQESDTRTKILIQRDPTQENKKKKEREESMQKLSQIQSSTIIYNKYNSICLPLSLTPCLRPIQRPFFIKSLKNNNHAMVGIGASYLFIYFRTNNQFCE